MWMDNIMNYLSVETSDGLVKYYLTGTERFKEIALIVESKYSNLDSTKWELVSEPVYNSILDDEVVSAIYKLPSPYLDHLDPIKVSRKYLLNKLHIYEKVYTLLTDMPSEFELPDNSKALAKGYLLNIYGQPGDEDYSNYIDIYFSCTNHADVEAFAGKTLIVGKHSNYYCITFNGTTKQWLKIKNYCYDKQNSLSNWNECWTAECEDRDIDIST
jgi:hypothetical protein